MALIATIQNLLCKEDCEKILNRSFNFPTQLVSYEITKFNKNVAGFLGDHLRLTIKYTSSNSTSIATYFMKTLPQFNLNQLDYVLESGIFKKEVILYRGLLSELLQINRFGPKCYLVKDNLIVLEDLQSKGFKMLSKHIYLPQEYCFSVLKNLAKYHSSSIIYEAIKQVKINKKFKDEIKETCFCFEEGKPRQKWLVSTTECVINLMKLLSVESCNITQVCQKYKNFVFNELETLLAPSKLFRNVLTHDDLWCNNFLFNENKECIFVDFQLVRYAPPGFDFLVTLYLNLNCSDVENNLSEFVDIYYKFLTEELEKKKLDINKELPRSEFEESLVFYKLAALTENAMYGTHIYVSDELSDQIVEDINKYNEFSFINRSKFAVKEFQDNPQFRNRITPALILLIKSLINKT